MSHIVALEVKKQFEKEVNGSLKKASYGNSEQFQKGLVNPKNYNRGEYKKFKTSGCE